MCFLCYVGMYSVIIISINNWIGVVHSTVTRWESVCSLAVRDFLCQMSLLGFIGAKIQI